MSDITFQSILPPSVRAELNGPVAAKLLSEYGVIFAAAGGAVPPDRLVFKDEAEVAQFQESVEIGAVKFGEITIELQRPAAEALANAVADAERRGLSISPRSADSGRRRFADTIALWLSRVEPALVHWVAEGKLDPARADRISALTPVEQVEHVFELEQRGLWFAKDLSKSIIYSVAPPGASQHLSMLAFDVTEFNEPQVREILAKHFWYLTVISDLPHFTYLGIAEEGLKRAGLRPVAHLNRTFWVPDI
jgi:hypothetical protein